MNRFLVALDAPIALAGASTHSAIARHRSTAKNKPWHVEGARAARVVENARAQFERETMARDDYAPSLTPYTREDASHLAETPGVKRLDPGVRVLAVASRDEATGAPRVLLCHPLRHQRLHDPSPRALERSNVLRSFSAINSSKSVMFSPCWWFTVWPSTC